MLNRVGLIVLVTLSIQCLSSGVLGRNVYLHDMTNSGPMMGGLAARVDNHSHGSINMPNQPNFESQLELAEPLEASASYTHHKKGSKGWLDMGAWTHKKGAFGWYADYPVGKGK